MLSYYYLTNEQVSKISKYAFQLPFNFPLGIVIDDNNIIYIIEGGNDSISTFTTDGDFICSFGRNGSSEGQFNNPHEMIIDKEGYLYIYDYYNNRLVVY